RIGVLLGANHRCFTIDGTVAWLDAGILAGDDLAFSVEGLASGVAQFDADKDGRSRVATKSRRSERCLPDSDRADLSFHDHARQLAVNQTAPHSFAHIPQPHRWLAERQVDAAKPMEDRAVPRNGLLFAEIFQPRVDPYRHRQRMLRQLLEGRLLFV